MRCRVTGAAGTNEEATFPSRSLQALTGLHRYGNRARGLGFTVSRQKFLPDRYGLYERVKQDVHCLEGVLVIFQNSRRLDR